MAHTTDNSPKHPPARTLRTVAAFLRKARRDGDRPDLVEALTRGPVILEVLAGMLEDTAPPAVDPESTDVFGVPKETAAAALLVLGSLFVPLPLADRMAGTALDLATGRIKAEDTPTHAQQLRAYLRLGPDACALALESLAVDLEANDRAQHLANERRAEQDRQRVARIASLADQAGQLEAAAARMRHVAEQLAALSALAYKDGHDPIGDELEIIAADLAHDAEQLDPTPGGSVWDRTTRTGCK